MKRSKSLVGFTLIEMVAVVAIMGLLSAASMLTLAHTAVKQRRKALVQQLEQMQWMTRLTALQTGKKKSVVFDLDAEQVFSRTAGESQPILLFGLSDGNVIEAVTTVSQTVHSGQVAIDFNSDGFARDYALCIAFGDGKRCWMIVAGLSGQVTWSNDDTQVDAIFQALRSHSVRATGDDAD